MDIDNAIEFSYSVGANCTEAVNKLHETICLAIEKARLSAAEHGDIGFVVVCAALVFIMTPGLGFFYSGMARTKNALSLIMICFLSMSVVLIQWLCFGFSLTFSARGNVIIGDCYYCGGTHVGDGFVEYSTQPPISTITFFIYQAMFATITPALIFGSTAERVRIMPSLLFILIWTTCVYDFIAHWTWSPDGWLATLGALDYAGGGPVHIASGFSGLAMAVVLGKRTGYTDSHKEWKPHSLNNVLLGTALLWFGWFGFNGGSAIAGTSRAALAATTTNLAAAAGGLTWMFMDYRGETKRLSALAFCSGAVAGLVGITPGSGFVAPWAAVVIGISTAVICNLGSRVKHLIGYDDSLDGFGVHGVGGFVGNLLTAFFAQKWVARLDGAEIPGGWVDGNYEQMAWQLVASLAAAGWSFTITALITLAMKPILKLPKHLQLEGVDKVEFGEAAYHHHRGSIAADVIVPVENVRQHIRQQEAEKDQQAKGLSSFLRPGGSIFRSSSWTQEQEPRATVVIVPGTIIEADESTETSLNSTPQHTQHANGYDSTQRRPSLLTSIFEKKD